MRTTCLALIAALTVVLASPAGADPPERFEFNGWFVLADEDHDLVLFVNIDRESRCTAEVVASEQAFLEWLVGGQVGPPPPEPEFPNGFAPFQIQRPDIGSGAQLSFLRGDDVYVELWHRDVAAERGNVGPCLDTDDRAERFAAGTGDWAFHATDFAFTGTRANVFDLALHNGDIVDADGQRYRYRLHGLDNVSCFDHARGLNACAVRSASLQPVGS